MEATGVTVHLLTQTTHPSIPTVILSEAKDPCIPPDCTRDLQIPSQKNPRPNRGFHFKTPKPAQPSSAED